MVNEFRSEHNVPRPENRSKVVRQRSFGSHALQSVQAEFSGVIS